MEGEGKERKEMTEDWRKCWWKVRDGKRMMKWKRKWREEEWKEWRSRGKAGRKM